MRNTEFELKPLPVDAIPNFMHNLKQEHTESPRLSSPLSEHAGKKPKNAQGDVKSGAENKSRGIKEETREPF
jgi:hypothetical protein